ncbi:MAG: NifU N-terminal domain-containing protein [Acidimicrobiia bacterium]
MVVQAERTPNPNAMKFTVSRDVGEPRTFVAGQEHGDPMADELLALNGVTSIFMVSDFVTISKTDEAAWSEIEPEAVEVLKRYFN